MPTERASAVRELAIQPIKFLFLLAKFIALEDEDYDAGNVSLLHRLIALNISSLCLTLSLLESSIASDIVFLRSIAYSEYANP